MKTFFQRYTPLQIAMHVYAWSAPVVLIFDLFTDNLTANPIQALEQRTGRHAITLLVLSLACTPLNTLFKWPELLKRRRALGLYAFMYAVIHVLSLWMSTTDWRGVSFSKRSSRNPTSSWA